MVKPEASTLRKIKNQYPHRGNKMLKTGLVGFVSTKLKQLQPLELILPLCNMPSLLHGQYLQPVQADSDISEGKTTSDVNCY